MMDKKILIVDDDPNIREVLAVLLGSDSYDVEAAEDGKQAVDRVTGGGHYDLIILDIMMPNMDGVEIRIRTRWRPTPAGETISW